MPIVEREDKSRRLGYTDATSWAWRCVISAETNEPEPGRRLIQTEEEFLEFYGETLETAVAVVGRALWRWYGTPTPQDVEDAISEAMEKLLHAPHEAPRRPRPFFAAVARNVVRDAIAYRTAARRGGGQVGSIDALPPGVEPIDRYNDTQDEALWRQFLLDADTHIRQEAPDGELHVWNELFDPVHVELLDVTNADLAVRLDRPVGTVGRLAAAVRARFRAFAEGYFEQARGGDR